MIFLLCFLAVIFAFGAFILRDVIFKGRSLGKRIFGLYIYDKNSLEQASTKQCVLRNVFLFLYIVDGIILLVTGQTIGDRVAGTLVMSQKNLELQSKELREKSPVPKQKNVKKVVLVFAIIVGCLTIFGGLLQIILNIQKDTEEYKVAYSYFVQSHTFKELNVDESKIRFNQYRLNTYTSPKDNSVTQTVEIGFIVNFESFEVVCHKEKDIWQVCNECTLFE